jgi:hypothetical protein
MSKSHIKRSNYLHESTIPQTSLKNKNACKKSWRLYLYFIIKYFFRFYLFILAVLGLELIHAR